MKTTIVIPERRHPNFLEVCLEALIKNSRYKHDILVICSSITENASDFRYDKNTKKRYQKYSSIEEFLKIRKNWIEDNNIIVIDNTEKKNKLKTEYENKEKKYDDGIDIALNNNTAIDYIKTEWFFWNWDDDFIATPDWDINLLKHVDTNRHDRVYVPAHVQPYFAENPEIIDMITKVDPKDSWTTSRHIACGRLTMPITSRSENYLLESEMIEFVRNNTIHDIIEERCSARERMHWVPMLLEKSLYQSVGGNVYKDGSGYDLVFDDKLGKLGIMKIMSRDSFIVHRGYMIWDMEIINY